MSIKTPILKIVRIEEKVTEEMIRARAYQLFEEKICQEGHAEYDWEQAESDVFPSRQKT